MSPKFPVATAKDAVPIAEKLGFVFRRQRGSHAIYVRSKDNARVVIPVHGKADLKRKTLRGIINDMGITVEEFARLL